ncbi:MAG: hypothetical protein JHC52_12135, partial [Chthoniobacterales bacterium]|nr:hypothetical protein [Chthoniobacterales bacterium]
MRPFVAFAAVMLSTLASAGAEDSAASPAPTSPAEADKKAKAASTNALFAVICRGDTDATKRMLHEGT